ncbi:MAG: dihydroneopterin aldolase [Candidatus Omnitrophica bacterium]|nr:dihydroneopterin aldolase [Candidatus Omnitrophota bacterium]
MQKIHIHNLKIRTIIGTLPKERKTKQLLLMDITIEYDAAKACQTDDLKFALDYAALVKSIKAKVEKTSFHLIEKIADYIAEIVLEHKLVNKTQVVIKKPKALSGNADYVAFELVREQ